LPWQNLRADILGTIAKEIHARRRMPNPANVGHTMEPNPAAILAGLGSLSSFKFYLNAVKRTVCWREYRQRPHQPLPMPAMKSKTALVMH